MQYTTNYNIPKYDATDLLNPTSREGINSGNDIIDNQLKTNADAIGTKANSSDVYAKSQTYSKTEANNLLDTKANAVINTKEHTLFKSALEGKNYITTVDTDTAYTKDIDAGTLPIGIQNSFGGKTVAFNQLVNPSSIVSRGTVASVGLTLTTDGNGKVTVSGTSLNSNNLWFMTNFTIIGGHKYVLISNINSSNYGIRINRSGNYYSDVFTNSTTSASTSFEFWFNANVDCACEFKPLLFDLTQMGLDSITSVAEFKAIFPNDYYEYNTGELKSAGVTSVESEPFNIWDEVWELGTINASTGANQSDSGRIRSKNYIPILPNTTYYCRSVTAFDGRVCYYDKNSNFISGASTFPSSASFTTPNGAFYMKFSPNGMYGTTYNNDICINKSNATLNGTYKPHWNGSTYSVPAQVQALDGYGRSAGSVYNEVNLDTKKYIKRVGSVDLGSLNWSYGSHISGYFNANIPQNCYLRTFNGDKLNIVCSKYPTVTSTSGIPGEKQIGEGFTGYYGGYLFIKDSDYTNAQAFKTALSGVMLYYELATPTETDISSYLTEDNLITVEEGGTLTFANNLTDMHLPVPNKETFSVKVADAI